jgi:type IV pilus assembly protein PilO
MAIDFKDKRQLALIAAVAGLAVVYLYVNFLLLPQIRGVVKSYAKAKKVETDVKTAKRDISEIAELKKQVAQSRGKIESYESMLPAEQEVPKLLEDLSTIAKESNVKILGITPLPARQESRSPGQIYQETPILINARSGYHELGRFLSQLENSSRFMKVVDIDIKADRSSSKRHDVELLVLTYVLLENG